MANDNEKMKTDATAEAGEQGHMNMDDAANNPEGVNADDAQNLEDAEEYTQERLAELFRAQKAMADEQRLRNMAEIENVKKRLQREKEEQVRFAAEKVLADLLPTLDNLDLALQYGQGDAACKNVIIGVEMTRKLLLDALAKHGLEPVGTAGEEFSPEIHEGIGYAESNDMPANHVAAVMQRGYKLKERLLRPAKVMISKG